MQQVHLQSLSQCQLIHLDSEERVKVCVHLFYDQSFDQLQIKEIVRLVFSRFDVNTDVSTFCDHHLSSAQQPDL